VSLWVLVILLLWAVRTFWIDYIVWRSDMDFFRLVFHNNNKKDFMSRLIVRDWIWNWTLKIDLVTRMSFVLVCTRFELFMLIVRDILMIALLLHHPEWFLPCGDDPLWPLFGRAAYCGRSRSKFRGHHPFRGDEPNKWHGWVWMHRPAGNPWALNKTVQSEWKEMLTHPDDAVVFWYVTFDLHCISVQKALGPNRFF